MLSKRRVLNLLRTLILAGLVTSTLLISSLAEKQGEGIVIVGNLPPSITSISLYEYPVAGQNFTAIDPGMNHQYALSVNVSDLNGLIDIRNVTLYLYAASGTQGVFNKRNSYGFQYDNVTANWKELSESGWVTAYSYLNASVSSWPQGSTWGVWRFVFGVDETAHRESTWTLKVIVYDLNGESDSATYYNLEVHLYISFTIPSIVSWSGSPGTNITATGMPANIVVTSNDVVGIQIRGSGDLVRDGGTETISLSNVYVGKTSDRANNDGIELTASYQSLYTSLSSPDGESYSTYWFLTIPLNVPAGVYRFTYYIQVVA